MLVPEIAPYIKDNNNCKSHGKDIYLSLAEYSYYTGDYDKDTNTFTYDPDKGEYAGSGDMEWCCGQCSRTIEWVGHNPQAEAI